jgi:anti-sigma factor RsiW
MSECGRVRDLLGPYVYDDLADEERSRVDAHLGICEACRNWLDACRAVPANLRADALRPSAAEEARMHQALAGRIAESRRQAREALQRRTAALRLAAIAAAALVAGVWIGHRVSRGPAASSENVLQPPHPLLQQADADFGVPDTGPQMVTPAKEAVDPGADVSTPLVEQTGPGVDAALRPAPVTRHMLVIQAPRPQGPDDVTLAAVPHS